MSKEASVKPLADLFTIVIGLSLTIALQNSIAANNPFPLRMEVLPALLAFLLTVLPFTHGAIVHLMTTYGDEHRAATPNSASLLVDYFILFINGCIFIGWAILLPNTEYATYAYMSILLVDAIWGSLARIFSGQSSNRTPSVTWAIINIATFIILFMSVQIVIGSIYKPGWDKHVSWVIFAIAGSRTIVDYSLTWKFYAGKTN